MRGGDEPDALVFFVDLVEEAPGADAEAPSKNSPDRPPVAKSGEKA
jgi:hypothetical protein